MNALTDSVEISKNIAIHEEILTEVGKRMPPLHQIQLLAELYKAFGDDARLSLVLALGEAEMCVCDLCALLNMKQSAVSHQLNKLKLAGLIKNRREGKMVFYSIADEYILEIIKTGMDHVTE